MHDIRAGTCPLCNALEIIECVSTEACIARGAGAWDDPPDQRPKFGRLATYTCRACGFTQWFASKPGEIPIGYAYGTRLVTGPAPVGPYR